MLQILGTINLFWYDIIRKAVLAALISSYRRIVQLVFSLRSVLNTGMFSLLQEVMTFQCGVTQSHQRRKWGYIGLIMSYFSHWKISFLWPDIRKGLCLPNRSYFNTGLLFKCLFFNINTGTGEHSGLRHSHINITNWPRLTRLCFYTLKYTQSYAKIPVSVNIHTQSVMS